MHEEDACLKDMIANLAKAINRAISESANVKNALDAIKGNGYTADVSLAACIGLHKPENSSGKAENIAPVSFEFNQNDLAFLKSLKIKLDEN
jgi:hypothetical protein